MMFTVVKLRFYIWCKLTDLTNLPPGLNLKDEHDNSRCVWSGCFFSEGLCKMLYWLAVWNKTTRHGQDHGYVYRACIVNRYRKFATVDHCPTAQELFLCLCAYLQTYYVPCINYCEYNDSHIMIYH